MRHSEIIEGLRAAQTEDEVEELLQRATHFSLRYKWANWQNAEVQELGARRRREMRNAES